MNKAQAFRDSAAGAARETKQGILTYLICPSVLLRSGFSHILSGTQFNLSPDEFKDPSDVQEISNSEPFLLLVCTNGASSEPAQIVESLKEKCPSARVVIVADHIEPKALIEAYKVGIDGICGTGMDRHVLLKTLELVMLGERFIPASMGLGLLDGTPESQQAAGGSNVLSMRMDSNAEARLSGREQQILHWLVEGASNKHIARQLGVAEATVKVHVKAILRKAKVANRTQAAMWAQRHAVQGVVAAAE